MLFKIISADICPIFAAGWVMVDKLGAIISEMGSLLKPMTAKSSGIRRPHFLALCMALTAIMSPEANNPSGLFFRSNNLLLAFKASL